MKYLIINQIYSHFIANIQFGLQPYNVLRTDCFNVNLIEKCIAYKFIFEIIYNFFKCIDMHYVAV